MLILTKNESIPGRYCTISFEKKNFLFKRSFSCSVKYSLLIANISYRAVKLSTSVVERIYDA